VSSVQRDLSLENCTDEYNSILNSSDVSNTENNDQIGVLRDNPEGQRRGLYKELSKGMLHNNSSQGMNRIKSSAKLFTIDKNILPDNEEEKELGGGLRMAADISKQSYESENISDMSTGDSAYPVVAFNNRLVKEFEPKISMKFINSTQNNLVNYISRVPAHTKLKYESPMHTKTIQSPPQQASFSDLSDSAAPHTQFEEKKFKVNPNCFKNYANRSSSSSIYDSSIDEGFATRSIYQPLHTDEQCRINLMPLNKPF
jgi:hypothetical protein